MDELGIYERDALEFQAHVFRVLDSPLPVLGVLKDKSSPFWTRCAGIPPSPSCPFPPQPARLPSGTFLDQVRSR